MHTSVSGSGCSLKLVVCSLRSAVPYPPPPPYSLITLLHPVESHFGANTAYGTGTTLRDILIYITALLTIHRLPECDNVNVIKWQMPWEIEREVAAVPFPHLLFSS